MDKTIKTYKSSKKNQQFQDKIFLFQKEKYVQLIINIFIL